MGSNTFLVRDGRSKLITQFSVKNWQNFQIDFDHSLVFTDSDPKFFFLILTCVYRWKSRQNLFFSNGLLTPLWRSQIFIFWAEGTAVVPGGGLTPGQIPGDRWVYDNSICTQSLCRLRMTPNQGEILLAIPFLKPTNVKILKELCIVFSADWYVHPRSTNQAWSKHKTDLKFLFNSAAMSC